MVIEKGLQSILSKLKKGDPAQITIGGASITICMLEKNDKFSLSTPVYFGGNYIPKSVRNSVLKHPRFGIVPQETFLTIDEEEYKVVLNQFFLIAGMSIQKFTLLLEEFNSLADDWRVVLDENDKNDLVHVYVN